MARISWKEGMVRTVGRQERSDRGVCEVVSRVVMELERMFCATVEQVLPVTRSFRCAWYSEYVCFAAEVFRRRERMQVGTERSEVLEEDFRESLCSWHVITL